MVKQQTNTEPAGRLLEGWLTREQVAAELGVSADTLYRWRIQRIGPPWASIGRQILYRADAFRAWLLAHENTLDLSQRRPR